MVLQTLQLKIGTAEGDFPLLLFVFSPSFLNAATREDLNLMIHTRAHSTLLLLIDY